MHGEGELLYTSYVTYIHPMSAMYALLLLQWLVSLLDYTTDSMYYITYSTEYMRRIQTQLLASSL